MNETWPSADDPVVAITFELVVGFDHHGRPLYDEGEVERREEIEEVGRILEETRPHQAAITAKPMGRVDLKLASGAHLTLRPVFHPTYNEYRDLFKVDHLDCPMSESFAALLNKWRNELADKGANKQ